MKKLTSMLLFLVFAMVQLNAQTFYGTPPVSKIADALNKKQVNHTLNTWQLEELKSDNKFTVSIDAVEYSTLNSTEKLKGLKLSFKSENVENESNAAKTLRSFEAYIDFQDYAEILVVINQLKSELAKREKANQKGSNTYITKGGIKFGYDYTASKEAAFISLLYSNAEVMVEFSNIDKFLGQFKGFVEIASKDLYLPQNSDKLKKAKKSNLEAKDVIIDDI
jgi:hypothetical protein